MMRVELHNTYDSTYGDVQIIQTSSIGSYELLEVKEYEQIKNAIMALQDQVQRLKRTVRNVCIDTENPIHF